MRNHKLIGWVVGIPLLVIILILVIVLQEPDKAGISRAMAAKSVALALQSPDELKTWQKEYKSSFSRLRLRSSGMCRILIISMEKEFWSLRRSRQMRSMPCRN